MNKHIRAELLLGQSRFSEAEKVLRETLANDPDDGVAHTLLSLAQGGQEKFDEAIATAKRAAKLAPLLPTAYYAMALSYFHVDNHLGALSAIKEAVRLDPEDADFLGLLASIHGSQEKWTDALRAADQGLAIDAAHDNCLNVRATALTHLGRHDEAQETIKHALTESPENAHTHLVTGLSHMHRGEYPRALEHFRETLRIDPTIDQARLGIVECMKARNVFYRSLLGFFLWMSRQSSGFRTGLIVGGFIGARILKNVSDNSPEWKPYLTPLLAAYLLFVYFSWSGDAIFNLLLRLDPEGRLALDRTQRQASTLIGACVAGTLLFLVLGLALGLGPLMWVSLVFLLLTIPLSVTFKCEPGWPRQVMTAYVLGLIVCAVVGSLLVFVVTSPVSEGGPQSPLRMFGVFALVVFLGGSMLSSWAGGMIADANPRRGFWSFWISKRGLLVIGLAILFVVLPMWSIARDQKTDARWDALVAARLQAGDPVLIRDIEELRPAVPDAENGTLIISELSPALSSIVNEQAPAVLIFDIKLESAMDVPSQDSLAASRSFLERHRATVDKLLTLQRYDRGRLPLSYVDALNEILKWKGPNLEVWRTASLLLGLETVLTVVESRTDLSVDALVAQFRLARLLDTEPDVVAQLYRCGIETNALFGMEFFLANALPTEDQVRRLLAEVENRIERASVKPALVFNRASHIEMLAQWKSGRVKSNELGFGPLKASHTTMRDLQVMMVEEYDELINASDSYAKLRELGVRLNSPGNGPDERKETKWLESVFPSLFKAVEKHLVRVAALQVARVGLLAEQYRFRTGKLPVKWDDMVPEELPAPVGDQFANAALIMHRDDKGLIISSIGPDEELPNRSRQKRSASDSQSIEMRLLIPESRRSRMNYIDQIKTPE